MFLNPAGLTEFLGVQTVVVLGLAIVGFVVGVAWLRRITGNIVWPVLIFLAIMTVVVRTGAMLRP